MRQLLISLHGSTKQMSSYCCFKTIFVTYVAVENCELCKDFLLKFNIQTKPIKFCNS